MSCCGQGPAWGLRKAFLELSIQFVFPSLLRRDLDGGLKITQDALCEALDINDNRILAIMLSKHCDPSNPRIEISSKQGRKHKLNGGSSGPNWSNGSRTVVLGNGLGKNSKKVGRTSHVFGRILLQD